jgi:hypothetical protein
MLALFDPRFIKHDLLVGKYKITLGDQYDGVLKGSRWVDRSGVKAAMPRKQQPLE